MKFLPTRRSRVAVFLACSTLLFAAACSGDDSDSNAGAGDGGATDAGHVFAIVTASEPTSLYPLNDGSRVHQIVSRAFYDPLMTKSADFSEVTGEGLVTAVEQTTDTTFTLSVREGVQFHDGTALDGEAVAFSIEYAATQATLKGYYDVFSSATGNGDTAEVTTAFATTPEFVSSILTEIPALSPDYVNEKGEDFQKEPVGTGPMKFVEWVPGQRVVGERFDDYWAGEPASAGMEATFNPDGAARLAQVQAGDADLTMGVDYSLVDSLNDNAGVEVVSSPGPNYLHMAFNMTNAPTDDLRIRRAIIQAIDTEQIANDLLNGHGTPQPNLYGENGAPGVGTKDPLPYDPDAASKLIAEVTAEKGDLPAIQYDYALDRYPAAKPIGEYIAQQLEQVGLDVEAKGSGLAEFVPKLVGADGLFDNMYTTVTADWYPGQSYYMNYKAFMNKDAVIPYCGDAQFNDLNDAWAAAGTDLAAKNAAEMESQTLLVADLACFRPLVLLDSTWVMSPTVTGFEARLDEQLAWDAVGVTS
jgi:ABC-type transport system substrate-binding protein